MNFEELRKEATEKLKYHVAIYQKTQRKTPYLIMIEALTGRDCMELVKDVI